MRRCPKRHRHRKVIGYDWADEMSVSWCPTCGAWMQDALKGTPKWEYPEMPNVSPLAGRPVHPRAKKE